MSPPKHFLIAGATGRQGGAVVTALLSDSFRINPKNVWAITRDATGASAQRLLSKWPGINIVAGDLNNPYTLFEQLGKSILPQTAVFLAQAHGPTELSDAKGFTDAASSHGVAYFVYSSVDRGGREISDSDPSYCKTFSDKFHIEQHLKSVAGGGKGMDYTILRPTWFADNAHWGFPGKLCMTGWRDWMKGKRMQVVTTRDIGRWAAEGLVRPDRTGIRNEALSIASDELSFEDIDLIFKRKTGKGVPVTFRWAASLMIWLVKDLNTMFSFINERDYGADLPWLKERLEPTTFEQWVDTIPF
ncbi:related to nucleoside-diphosphate-sugar epimerase family protein [Phialocephala subalpina]|uniref:Related to nucleoside-diphosphate-sugar epimerase family protein n=1 Tax=Phialocephala subalpina TaxID=576137 RepID=A0A1L7WU95_9HELO|nr:related to nucleoside-diphosphate-sugar epimerase family protein [Phialocephala subalpina]